MSKQTKFLASRGFGNLSSIVSLPLSVRTLRMKVWGLQGVNCGGEKEWSKISVWCSAQSSSLDLHLWGMRISLLYEEDILFLRGVSPTRVDQRAALHWTLTSVLVHTSPWGCGLGTFYSGDLLPSIQSISGDTARTAGILHCLGLFPDLETEGVILWG